MTTCRRAPQGANPVLIYENLPIEVKFSSGGMGHAALRYLRKVYNKSQFAGPPRDVRRAWCIK